MNRVESVRKFALVKYGGSDVAVKFPGWRTPLIQAELVTGSHVGEPASFQPVMASRGIVTLDRRPSRW